ncbi:uncharacterized protein BT62DRAFT_919321 [Guyanagaster necrorhizus]|uniref:DUF7330 domain-containing protein n=1 Tax=Guyanagaster necrorhizus TaxID=856835 RepID=A0A9P7VUA5_9AGAR|nr:uncharacterized protein BT62DRAFT_919321 [Guyanagaster necrorhizus MCA 3950]KAG7446712.1 hypothetical protein BT62DRAFT_919321 [Guyanagaster necrorhizus MCA 3950]
MSHSDSSLQDTFIINLFLEVPAEILPPLQQNETEADQKNLWLEVENDNINVDLYIVGETPLNTPIPWTTIHLELFGTKENSRTFFIKARIHMPNPNCPAFHLTAKALDGFILFYIPHSYYGIIIINCSTSDLNDHIMLLSGMYDSSTVISKSG